MECFICHSQMVCYDDVNNENIRIDWLKCPRCDSKTEIQYNPKGNLNKITWENK